MPKDINITLGKNIQLIGFEALERSELDIIDKILAKHLSRIDHEVAYNLLRIKLRQHQKNKSFSHELEADLILTPRNIVTASLQYKNLYNGLNIVMQKLIAGIEHKIKKKQPQHPIRKMNEQL